MNLRTAIRNAVRGAIHEVGIANFPPKDFYFADFAGIANATTLRSLTGWSAYNDVALVHASRDRWQVQSGAIARTAGNDDYDAAPGKYIIGRELASTNHVFRARMVTKPGDGAAIMLAVAATSQKNSIVLTCSSSGGLMQNFTIYKNVNGTLTQLLSQSGSTSPLGRRLQSGDEIELRVLGQFVHLFVNGYRITPAGGASLDTGGAFVKGTICGFGTGQGLGSVFDDVYMAELSASVTMADTQIFWPGDIALAGRDVPLFGTYVGDVQALDYRVVNSATGATVEDWARIQSPTIAAGAWSASAFVPMCSTASNPKIRVQVRAANDVDSRVTGSETAVGICVGSYGQSNSFYRGMGLATSHAVSNAYIFSAVAGSVWLGGTASTITRAQLWATQIAAASGIPCGVFVGGSGSKTLVELSTRGGGNFVLDEMEASCLQANAFGYVSSWLWTQGEAEASASAVYDKTAYYAQFDVLMSELRSGASGGKPVKFGICPIGSTTGGHLSGATFGDANWSAMRAGLFGLTEKPGVFVACNLTDGVSAEGVHYTADTYVENGRRAGLSIRKELGYGGYDGRGPLITGATRAGAVVTLAIDLNGAASIAGTGLTHYQVSADNFATLLTVSLAAVVGGNIALTLSADPGAAVKVRSFYGMDWTSPVRAIGTYADGTTIPVEPLFAPITAA